MSNNAQWRNMPDGASGSSTINAKLRVASGAPDHCNSGERLRPSLACLSGMAALMSNDGLRMLSAMVSS
jgi:hypothetical protein